MRETTGGAGGPARRAVRRAVAGCVVRLLSVLLASGCSRESTFPGAPPAPQLGAAGLVPLPDEASLAEKRGFCDFNGDGLTDMVEISDRAIVGQDWQGLIYLGRRGDRERLAFTRPYAVSLPLTAKWLSSQVKIDTADVNGDGFCDVVMTQYRDGVLKDTFHITIGMNQGDGHRFRFVEDITQSRIDAGEQLLRLLALLGFDTDERVSNWFKMDWADMDGDGRDDLCLFWRADWLARDLMLEVWPSTTPKEQRSAVTLGAPRRFALPRFLTNLKISALDTGDLDGDRLADILIYDPRVGTQLRIAYARNSGSQFVVHRDFWGSEIEMDFIGFEKRDSFDINLDGCDDYVHAGTQGPRRYISYLLSPCAARPKAGGASPAEPQAPQ